MLPGGDVVDGKSVIAERLLSVLDAGYAAYYVYDPSTRAYRVVASAWKPKVSSTIKVGCPSMPQSMTVTNQYSTTKATMS